MLKTKSILAPKEDSDGKRISIMSRHTLNDGITPHPQIDSDSYDVWMLELAPPEKLIGDYLKRELPWEQFKNEYVAYMQRPEIKLKVRNLARHCIDSVVTLLCVEESPEHCHRRLLAEECKRYYPYLVLIIN